SFTSVFHACARFPSRSRPDPTRRCGRSRASRRSIELPAAELELVLEALERVGRRLPEDRTRSLFAKAADALVQMARESLAGGASSAEDGGSSSECCQVMVLVEAKALSGNGGESDLPLPVVERLCCDGSIVPVVTGEERTPLAVGRKQRG